MVRISAQVLIGLMLSFGVVTLAARAIAHISQGRIPRAAYFLLLSSVLLVLVVLSFRYAYSGLTESGWI